MILFYATEAASISNKIRRTTVGKHTSSQLSAEIAAAAWDNIWDKNAFSFFAAHNIEPETTGSFYEKNGSRFPAKR